LLTNNPVALRGRFRARHLKKESVRVVGHEIGCSEPGYIKGTDENTFHHAAARTLKRDRTRRLRLR
jgi:hypothetical protein